MKDIFRRDSIIRCSMVAPLGRRQNPNFAKFGCGIGNQWRYQLWFRKENRSSVSVWGGGGRSLRHKIQASTPTDPTAPFLKQFGVKNFAELLGWSGAASDFPFRSYQLQHCRLALSLFRGFVYSYLRSRRSYPTSCWLGSLQRRYLSSERYEVNSMGRAVDRATKRLYLLFSYEVVFINVAVHRCPMGSVLK